MPANPTRLLLTTDFTGGGTLSNTTPSVSPAANALVVVHFVGGKGNGPWSVTSGFATGGWTEGARASVNNADLITYWAVTTGTPGSGTITLTTESGAVWLDAVAVDQVASGFNTTTPIGATITGAAGQITTGTTTPSATFSATPASSSLLIGAMNARWTEGGLNPDTAPNSGMTRIGDRWVGFRNVAESAYAPGTHGSSIGWTIQTGTEGIAITGIEVLAGASTPVLSSPSVTSITQTGATVNYSTDTGGTAYIYKSTSATPPSTADLKAGTGAVYAANASVASGARSFTTSGGSADTLYYWYVILNDGDDDSNVLSGSFTTSAAVGATHPFTSVNIGG